MFESNDIVEAYRKIYAVAAAEPELVAALNLLRSGTACHACACNTRSTRKLRQTLTKRNKEIRDLKNQIELLRAPRQGMSRFRPLAVETVEAADVQDFAHDLHNGAFFDHRRKI